MRLRDIVVGTAVTVTVLTFIVLLLRSCTRGSGGDARGTSLTGEVISTFLTPCTADVETRICSPQEKHLDRGFDWEGFLAQVRESRRSSSSSSSSRGSLRGSRDTSSGSLLDRMLGRIGRSRSSGSSSSARSSPSPRSTATDSAVFGIIGRDESGFSEDADGGFGTDDGADDGEASSLAPIGDRDGGTGFGGGIPSGTCLRSRSLLSIFDLGELTTGTIGWTFPVMISGDCPITAAMLKARVTGTFGGPLDDF